MKKNFTIKCLDIFYVLMPLSPMKQNNFVSFGTASIKELTENTLAYFVGKSIEDKTHFFNLQP